MCNSFIKAASPWLLLIMCISPVLSVVVDTQYGRVRGHSMDVDNGVEITKVDIFYGIPFAKDTSGPRRFANPEPPDTWAGVFEADTLREACPQSGGLLILTHPDWDSFGEDCLHLNIYTPNAASGSADLPVMVWVYGGAFQGGSNIQYPGHFLASRGVVIVVLNYRLNRFGFAFTGNDACPGNAGLWDQKMGLEFVINNIANFGGDPNKITVFGESAGAASASFLMLSPETKDLFNQAIMESGADTNPWNFDAPETLPDTYIRQVADDLGCSRPNDYQMIDCLRDLSWQNIFYNGSFSCPAGYGCGGGMNPVVDGVFMPMTPRELREQGDVMQGPIISGINKEDGALGVLGWSPLTLFGCCNYTYFQDILRNEVVSRWEGRLDNKTREDAFQAVRFNYSPWPYVNTNPHNREKLVQLSTDMDFGLAWDAQIKEHQNVAPTYAYIYNYRGRNTSIPEWMGVPHILEIPYVWGHVFLKSNPEVRNDSLMFGDLVDWTDEDIKQSIFVQELFTNFAKYGNPTPDPGVSNPLGETTIWPQFTFDDMNVLVIGNTSIETVQGWRQKDYAFWNEYMPYILKFRPMNAEFDNLLSLDELLPFFMEDIDDVNYFFEDFDY